MDGPTGKDFLILGCGFTGRRVAARLAATGARVWATSRAADKLRLPGVIPVELDVSPSGSLGALREVRRGVRVLHSLPLLQGTEGWEDPTPRLLEALGDTPARIVYLSTTGVYGATREVDETTPAAPRTPRESLRVEAEDAVTRGPWTSMVLRPAAIYGPGRGAHVSIAEGRFRLLGDGSNWVSRIHVEDLADLATAALLREDGGAWPVADELPARSIEVARFCADLLGVPMPGVAPAEDLDETRRANRRVDGRAVCRLLGVTLRYPTYLVGIPAALAGEANS